MKKLLLMILLAALALPCLPALAGDAAPAIVGLAYESQLELTYAKCFDAYFYAGGYALIDIYGSGRFLIVPEGVTAPEGLDEDVVVLQKPLDNIYLAATAAMSLFDRLDALDHVKLSSLDASGWYVENAVVAMEAGDMLFAGKYSQPDFELLVKQGCDLALESTMILHTPKVKEMLELLGIPVMIERSSYESHPLARVEWIKLFGILADEREKAEAYFQTQEDILNGLADFPNTGKTVAFFYISSDGAAVVRRSADYVPKMIELAGGRYIFEHLGEGEDTRRSTVSMTMEEFYATAVNADYLIYNAAVDAPLETMDDLLGKSALFKDFKAVNDGNVYSTGKNLYQATDAVGGIITDIHLMLTGDAEGMVYLYQIQ